MWRLNSGLQAHNLVRSHVPDVLFKFYFSRQGFIFPWLDDGCCCLRDLGAVWGPNVLIRVGGAGSRALMEAHAHTTSCTAENIYLSCRHNYHKATVYRRCFKCLVYRFFIRIVYTRARCLPSTSHCSCQRLRSLFYFISLISFMSGCSGDSFLVWCTTGMTLIAILPNCLKMSIYSIYWSFKKNPTDNVELSNATSKKLDNKKASTLSCLCL